MAFNGVDDVLGSFCAICFQGFDLPSQFPGLPLGELVVNVAKVPDEEETYEELLEINKDLPEYLDEKGVEVNDESMKDIDDLPKLGPATMEPTPIENVKVHNRVVVGSN